MRGSLSFLFTPMKGSLLVALACVLMPPALYADTTNLLTNPGAETGSLSGWFADTAIAEPFNIIHGSPQPHTGNYQFTNVPNLFNMELVQSVSVFTQGITAAMVNTGTLSAQFSFWENGMVNPDGSSFAPGNSGSGQVTILLEGATGYTSAVSTASSQNGAWTEGGGTVPIPVGTTTIVYQVDTRDTVPDPSKGVTYGDEDVFIDDNSLKILTPAGGGSGTGGSGVTSAPEIDPGSTAAALTLLLCAVAILRGKRQRVGRGPALAQ